MSKESRSYLQSDNGQRPNIVVGRIGETGLPWWGSANFGMGGEAEEMTKLGSEYRTKSGHQLFWDNFIPPAAILDGVFGWTALEIEPTILIDGDEGVPVAVPMDGYKAIVRNDTRKTMGVFKQGYQPHQPAQLVDLAMDLLSNEVGFTSAGALRDGAVIWLEASVNHEFHNEKAGFGFVPNLLLTTSFNGTLITDAIRTAKYSVCDNTHEIARSAKVARVGAKHTKFSLERLAGAHSLLGLIEQDAADMDAEITRMVETEISGKQFAKFLDLWVPIPEWKEGEPTNSLSIATKKRDGIQTMWISDDRVAPWKGTLLGAHQLISTWNEHGGRSEDDTLVDMGKRFHRNQLSILSGNLSKAQNEAEKALELAMA